LKYRSKNELRRALEKKKLGVPTSVIASELGISRNTLCRHWRVHLGTDVRKIYNELRCKGSVMPGLEIYTKRISGMTFREIAEEAGIQNPGSNATIKNLGSILHNYCRRVGCEYPGRTRPVRRCGICGANGHDRRTCEGRDG